jgi:hypothetical protein
MSNSGEFVTICRLVVDKAEESLEARALREAVKVIKEIVNNERSVDIAKGFLESKELERAESKLNKERYIYKISMGLNKFSLRSEYEFPDKSTAKQKGLRSLGKCTRNFHFRDNETGELVKFRANEIIVEDRVGDRRKREKDAQ